MVSSTADVGAEELTPAAAANAAALLDAVSPSTGAAPVAERSSTTRTMERTRQAADAESSCILGGNGTYPSSER